MDERLKDLIAGAIFIGMLAVNTLLQLNNGMLIRFVVLFGVLYHAWMLGKRFLPRANGLTQTLSGALFFFCLFSLGLTAWFYSGSALGQIADSWVLAGSMIVCQIFNFLIPDIEETNPDPTEAWNASRVIGAITTFVAASAAATFVVVSASRVATTASIRTPWPLLPHGTLAAIAVAWICIPLSIWLARTRWLSGIHAALALFATTSIVPIIYRIGFGFDGFLHLAGERQILNTGTLNPKPMYYIGQYVFTTWISRTMDLPIEHVDRWLVPVSAAIILALTATLLAREQKKTSLLVLALIPLSPFIATTPQSFAYILGIGAIFLSLNSEESVAWPAPLLLAAWSIATHPLAGAPLFLVTLGLLMVRQDGVRWRRITRDVFAGLMVIGAGLAVPAMFFLLSRTGSTPIQWNLSSIFSASPWLSFFASLQPWIGNHYVVWPAFATLLDQSIPFFGLIGWIWGLTILPKTQRAPFAVLGASGVALFLSGLILKTAGDFAFLIDYERGNYAERLFVLGGFCLVIAALPAIAHIFERARKQPSFFSFAILAAFAFITSAQAYNALPRNDALVVGHGWSASQTDVDAAKKINQDAGSQPYTVLADQSVSAAAVSEFGFKRYNGDIFFYPIPTGGKLYDVFLRMTYHEPSRDTAHEAAQLGNSKLVYVVLNDYWWNADAVGQSLESIADDHWSIGPDTGAIGTKAEVYKFDFTAP
jgi:hypothetical protein